MDFDIRQFKESGCFLQDEDAQMIIDSGIYIKSENKYYTVFKKHRVKFTISEIGSVTLLSYDKIKVPRYKLALIDNTMSFKQRCAVYLEQERFIKGQTLDDENLLIYGT